MHPNTPLRRKIYLAAVALAVVYATAMILSMLRFLQDAAKEAVPFGGHTLALGHFYVYSNRVAVFFLIVSCVLLAHALARMVQQASRWRAGKEI